MGRITLHPTSYGTIKVIGQVGHVHVGKYCSLADGIKAVMIGHNPNNISTYPFNKLPGWPAALSSSSHPVKYGDVNIKNDVWIGTSATILGGVEIGNGAIVAAEAVVTKSVLPYAIVAGNPAREVGRRFNATIAVELLKIRWWDWPLEKIQENAGLLCSKDIRAFIQKHGGS